MKLIIIHKNVDSKSGADDHLLRFVFSTEPIASIVLKEQNRNLTLNDDKNVMVAIPKSWALESLTSLPKIDYCNKNIHLSEDQLQLVNRDSWFIASNGRFVTNINHDLRNKFLSDVQADVVMLNVKPELLACCEKVILTSQSKVAGFRRVYSDYIEPASIPGDWPHHIFIKDNVLGQILTNGALPLAFSDFLGICSSKSLMMLSINVGGTVFDLGTEKGLNGFFTNKLEISGENYQDIYNKLQKITPGQGNNKIAQGARLFGKILLGQNLSIEQDTIIVGPTIIGNGVKIQPGAVIRKSIVGPGVCVPRDCVVQNRVLIDQPAKRESIRLKATPQDRHEQFEQTQTGHSIASTNAGVFFKSSFPNNFRSWPRFSYARCLKRIADIVAAITVLILFAPVFPVIALAVKLTSRGPLFFKDQRQGLYGKEFNCLKLRTMFTGADKMQDKLRSASHVDGPQFKMKNDPRLSPVGAFLRDTYIDEIPQFLNVLVGQMSVVGPRPSPKAENTLCPSWRDARLSVRPGITGLWQVCRTRQPMKDFQEWICYDTKYVKDVALKIDLWICWQTAKKIIGNFVERF
jgi:lipopolysaccharide/colanic/teichoic acid biosynthesis glycosyltransferase